MFKQNYISWIGFEIYFGIHFLVDGSGELLLHDGSQLQIDFYFRGRNQIGYTFCLGND
jgi:hypothetical protein